MAEEDVLSCDQHNEISMRFHEYTTLYQSVDHGNESISQWSERIYRSKSEVSHKYAVLMERDWVLLRRPYYSVWPSVAEALARVTLDVDCRLIVPPIASLLVRLSYGYELEINGRKLHSMLCTWYVTEGGVNSLAVICSCGDKLNDGTPVSTMGSIALIEGASVECQCSRMISGKSIRSDAENRLTITNAIRLAVAMCLIGGDPDLIEPDVLDKDRQHWAETRDETIVERAHRRGKIGWNVGRNIEVSPHYRRPHFGIRWSGHGRLSPRLVPVKGCVVKRKQLLEVPTGYLGDVT